MSAPVPVAGAAPSSRRARLGRYALWQLRDYSIGRGLPTFLIAAMFGGMTAVAMLHGVKGHLDVMPPLAVQRMIAQHGSLEGAYRSMLHDASSAFVSGFLGDIVFLGALLAVSGLVSNDRKLGHYRFIFSKPVSPARYYGQALFVHLAGFLVVITLLAAAYGMYVERVLTPALFPVVTLMFLMYAGLGFLMTTLVRWDWLALAVVVMAAKVLWARFGDDTGMLTRLLYILPPIHRTGDVYAALISGTAIPWHTLAWIGGYGLACFAAGLVVLRHRRLATP